MIKSPFRLVYVCVCRNTKKMRVFVGFTSYFGRVSTRFESARLLQPCPSSLFSVHLHLPSLYLISVPMYVTALLPILACPIVSCHSTSFEASSSGCLMQCPASFILLFLTFNDTGGRFP